MFAPFRAESAVWSHGEPKDAQQPARNPINSTTSTCRVKFGVRLSERAKTGLASTARSLRSGKIASVIRPQTENQRSAELEKAVVERLDKVAPFKPIHD